MLKHCLSEVAGKTTLFILFIRFVKRFKHRFVCRSTVRSQVLGQLVLIEVLKPNIQYLGMLRDTGEGWDERVHSHNVSLIIVIYRLRLSVASPIASFYTFKRQWTCEIYSQGT